MQPLRWRATFQSMVVKTSRNLLGVPANRSEPTVWIWFVQTYKTVTTATVERRRWSRIRIRKESDLQTNRTINCVYWYLEFTLEKPPWLENHKTLNEIHHICLEARFQKFLYHARTRANSPAMILQVNSSLSFLFPSLIWEYHQRFTHKDSPAIIYFVCVWFYLQLPSTTDETKS